MQNLVFNHHNFFKSMILKINMGKKANLGALLLATAVIGLSGCDKAGQLRLAEREYTGKSEICLNGREISIRDDQKELAHAVKAYSSREDAFKISYEGRMTIQLVQEVVGGDNDIYYLIVKDSSDNPLVNLRVKEDKTSILLEDGLFYHSNERGVPLK